MKGTTKLRGMSRRRAMGVAVSAVAGTAAVATLMRYLRPRPLDGPREVVLGDLSDARFARGNARIVRAEGTAVLVRHGADGTLRVLRTTCTHQGCPLHLEAEQLVCRCHGGRFDLDGRPIQGPPKTPLQEVPLTVRDGQLVITLGPDDV
ncbi:MAG: Rieske (2Fe-2S) protein [Candidatus Kapabacteria bacterium]|nr:Rieske (2Fe-2S) protein [Candidatus Kapabacteria bacterium]